MKANISFTFLSGQAWPCSFVHEPNIEVDVTDVQGTLNQEEVEVIRKHRQRQAEHIMTSWFNGSKISATIEDGKVTLNNIQPATKKE